MGEVWLAEQRDPVRRRVALKLIKAWTNTGARGLFRCQEPIEFDGGWVVFSAEGGEELEGFT